VTTQIYAHVFELFSVRTFFSVYLFLSACNQNRCGPGVTVLRSSCNQILSNTWKLSSLLPSKVSNCVVWQKQTFQTRLHFVSWKGWQHVPPKRWHLSTNIFLLCPRNVFPAIFQRSPLFWGGISELNNKMFPTLNMDLICKQSTIFKDRVTRVGRFTTTTNSSVW